MDLITVTNGLFDQPDLVWVLFGFFAGGLVKGVIGLGMPFIAIPVIASVSDVPTAVGIVAAPSILPNIMQLWVYRMHMERPLTIALICIATLIGTAVGVHLLVQIDKQLINQLLGLLLLAYIATRILNLQPRLSPLRGAQLAFPTGILSGILGGMTGISAPITLTYLLSLRLKKYGFIFFASAFFATIGSAQAIFYINANLITFQTAAISCFALIPIFLGMKIGGFAVRFISESFFEKIIFGVLTILAVKFTIF